MRVRVSRARRATGLLAALTVLGLLAAAPAMATFPGLNGKLVAGYESESEWGLKTFNSDGTGVVPLPAADRGWDPSFSPDGSQIAFEREDGIYVMGADGNGARRVSHTDNVVNESVDYEVREDSETLDLMTIKVSTWEWSGTGISTPRFMPGGETLAGVAFDEREWETAYCAVEEEGDQNCIEEGEPGAFFEYEGDYESAPRKVVLIGVADGASLGDLTTALPGSLSTATLGVAADGRIAIYYEAPSDSSRHVYIVPAGGGTPQKVPGTDEMRNASFSPDGSRLIGVVGEMTLAIVPVAGGPGQTFDLPKFVGAQEEWAGTPVFSPDGTKIAYHVETLSEDVGWSGAIYVANPDASGAAKVLDSAYRPSWQALAPPAPAAAAAIRIVPPKASIRKQVKLDKKGKALLGKIACGSSSCVLKVRPATLKIGKGKWSVKVTAPKKLAAKRSGKVRLEVSGKAVSALRQVGSGKLNAKIQIRDASGATSVTFGPSVKAAAKPKPRARKGRKN